MITLSHLDALNNENPDTTFHTILLNSNLIKEEPKRSLVESLDAAHDFDLERLHITHSVLTLFTVYHSQKQTTNCHDPCSYSPAGVQTH